MMKKKVLVGALAGAIFGGLAQTQALELKPYLQVGGSYQDATDSDMRIQDVKQGWLVTGIGGNDWKILIGARTENFKINLDKYGKSKTWTNFFSVKVQKTISGTTIYGLVGKNYSNNEGRDNGILVGLGAGRNILGWNAKAEVSYFKPADNHSFYRWQGTVEGTKKIYGLEIIPALDLQYVKRHKSKAYAKLKVAKGFKTSYGNFKPYIFGGIGEKIAWQEGLFADDTGRMKKAELGAGLKYSLKRYNGMLVGVNLEGEYARWQDIDSKESFKQLRIIHDTTGGYGVTLTFNVAF
jgi:uncharacterized membrane protein